MSSQVKLTLTANFVTHRKVKARDIYSSYLLMSGIVCFVLGIGNWIVGAVETSKYQNLLHRTEQTGLRRIVPKFSRTRSSEERRGASPHQRRPGEIQRGESETQLLLRGFDGRKNVVSFGVLLMLWSLIRLIRRDAQKKMSTLTRPKQTDKTGVKVAGWGDYLEGFDFWYLR